MNVTIDPHSGFCFGVAHAIEVAEGELSKNGKLFCLGDIVHNNMEVSRQKGVGLIIIDNKEFKNLKDCRVLIRAHGEPPETYRTAKENNIELIDASCPVVLKLQSDILGRFREMEEKNGQVVIYGKVGHAEVNGLQGQTNGKAIVIGGEQDLVKIDFSRPIRLYSQTTMSIEGFRKLVGMIDERVRKRVPDNNSDFMWKDSICRQVSNRSGQLQEFAIKFEVIVFVSGKKSSNGMILYEVCKNVNQRTYLVSGKDDLQQDWFKGIHHVGICGATSTPKWLMEEVLKEVEKING
jgi:4-hydroxy-3-methylbut-2-en-1-yl diphosphate reductase